MGAKLSKIKFKHVEGVFGIVSDLFGMYFRNKTIRRIKLD